MTVAPAGASSQIDDTDTEGFKLADHMTVVDNGTQSNDLFSRSGSPLHRFHCPADTEAETGIFR